MRAMRTSRSDQQWLRQLGKNVQRQRMQQGLTQQRLAELADVDIRNIQRIEAGEINVLLRTFARIQQAIGCAWEELLPPRS
jgi:transcriptional regulator with XRE-family HTH domain